jgi:nucleoside-diphosphate-sugar epimerase
MDVLVTGGLGRAGSWVVKRLADQNHDVTCVDQHTPEDPRSDVQFYAADLTDQGEAWELIQTTDPDYVVHFAAIPAVGIRAGTETFENNVSSTYNVLVAAGTADADVVWTSSESAYGTVFAEETWLPDYLPLDEAHELRPEDPYGTSKTVGEEVAKMVTRKYGVSVVSIRPSWVNHPGRYGTAETRESFDPETADLSGNFWSYVDVRDLSRAVEHAMDADVAGHEAVLAVADENYLDRPTAEVIEQVAGDLPPECDLEGDQSALSNAKVADLLGWEPAHSWRTAEDETAEYPAFRDW